MGAEFIHADIWTDVRTDMNKPEGALHDYANAPKEHEPLTYAVEQDRGVVHSLHSDYPLYVSATA